MAVNDLVTLPEVRASFGVTNPSDTRRDALWSAAITAASTAIVNFTERDFGSPQVTETRSFEYDGSGYLDIDDCTAVTDVSLVVPHSDNVVLDTDTWSAMPVRRRDAPVFFYIVMPRVSAYGISPAMGFTRNLDRWADEHGIPTTPQMVSVTATWGWPAIPADVKQATIWTIAAWTANPTGTEGLQSESIAGFARSWAAMTSALQALAIPNRARDLLANYTRVRA